MQKFIVNIQNRLWIFPALALITLIIGQICKTSCVFLHGDIFGLDLEIIGTAFYSTLLVSTIIYSKYYPRDWVMKIIAAIVSIGVGVEFILIRFQVQNSTYCPKCLISGFFFLVMFFVVIRHVKTWLVLLLILFGVLFASLTFNGAVTPSYAEKIECPCFGNDKSQTEIVIYSDYLCPICRNIDEQINSNLRKLKDKVKIRFVDVPLHAGSLEYAQVFLYAWFKGGNDLERAIKVREILFHAAETKTDQRGVLTILNSQKIPFKEDKENAKDIFRTFYNPSIKMDKINATPTVVIIKGNSKKTYVGGTKILKALAEI
jgi:hypothetical protein